jgi:UDP-glucose 6-dehydrogenase
VGIPMCESQAARDAGLYLEALYVARFPGVPCMRMSSDESELVKLAQNGFFAAKVAYFNAIYQLAQATGCNFETVREAVLADGRIAHAHTEVPGHTGLGYSGHCLPKDVNNLIKMFMDAGLGHETVWLQALDTCNEVRRGE